MRYLIYPYLCTICFLTQCKFSLVDCLDPDCSDHGVCVSGMCICRKGWKGNDCSDPDTDALRCLPDCSGHGQFDLELQKCVCDEKWIGPDCSQGNFLKNFINLLQFNDSIT